MQQLGARTMPQALQQVAESLDNGAPRRLTNANRITLLRDADDNRIAETRSVFLEGLRQAFGMALIGDQLYVANPTDGPSPELG
jgi:glucose/arabinose dehydrogenase